MLISQLRVGWRLLGAEPAHAIGSILGLSVGLAVCVLLLGLVRDALSYDRQIPQHEQIYLVNTRFNHASADPRWHEQAPQGLVAAIEATTTGTLATGYIPMTRSISSRNQVSEVVIHAVHPAFAQVFGVVPLAGDLNAALTRPDALALTQTAAHRLFGDSEALGQSVQIGARSYQVLAVLPSPPSATTVPYSVLAGFNSSIMSEQRRQSLQTSWGVLSGRVYVKLAAGASAASLTGQLQDAADRSPLRAETPADVLAELGPRRLIEIRLCALRDAYFQSDVRADPDSTTHGDWRMTLGLAGVALLILLLAVSNYVNLATVRTLRRQREVALRKVLGASVGQVAAQFLLESIAITQAAMVVGLLLALAVREPYAHLVNRPLDDLFTPATVAFCLLMGIVVGAAAGAYPAWVAARVRATQALSGRGNSETSATAWLRRVLTVAQFATALLLGSVCVAIALQTDHATRMSPGFDPAALIQVDLPRTTQMTSSANQAFRAALLRLPGVAGVAAAREIIGRNDVDIAMPFSREGHASVSLNVKEVSPEFFAVYRIAAVAGRVFDPGVDTTDSDIAVLNGAATRALGFAAPAAAIDQYINHASVGSFKVIGIAADVRHSSIREPIEPLLYVPSLQTSALTVRAQGDVSTVEGAVAVLWRQTFPNEVLRMNRARSVIAMNYADDLRVARLLALATLISLVMAAFGIYALSASSVQRRRREIVLRKLHGATPAAIGVLLGKEYLGLVAGSALIAMPIAALLIQRYLMGFVERAPVTGLALPAALGVLALVALLASLRQMLLAMRITPAKALRDN